MVHSRRLGSRLSAQATLSSDLTDDEWRAWNGCQKPRAFGLDQMISCMAH